MRQINLDRNILTTSNGPSSSQVTCGIIRSILEKSENVTYGSSGSLSVVKLLGLFVVARERKEGERAVSMTLVVHSTQCLIRSIIIIKENFFTD